MFILNAIFSLALMVKECYQFGRFQPDWWKVISQPFFGGVA
jgi:hypothetical protein